jgi:hypothetical protein
MPDLTLGYNLIRMLLGARRAAFRHCERSEAIQATSKNWIASSLTLLAMTAVVSQ